MKSKAITGLLSVNIIINFFLTVFIALHAKKFKNMSLKMEEMNQQLTKIVNKEDSSSSSSSSNKALVKNMSMALLNLTADNHSRFMNSRITSSYYSTDPATSQHFTTDLLTVRRSSLQGNGKKPYVSSSALSGKPVNASDSELSRMKYNKTPVNQNQFNFGIYDKDIVHMDSSSIEVSDNQSQNNFALSHESFNYDE